MDEVDIEFEKGEYNTKSGLTDCIYLSKQKVKSKKFIDYNLVDKSLLDSKDSEFIVRR